MSDPFPASGANYVIICSGRIAAQGAADPIQMIIAASNCAAQMSAHCESHFGASPADMKEVSVLQHELMETMHELKKDEAEMKCKEMFRLLYKLEKKFQ